MESMNLCLELPGECFLWRIFLSGDEPNIIMRAFLRTALETATERAPIPVDGDPSEAIALNEQRDKVCIWVCLFILEGCEQFGWHCDKASTSSSAGFQLGTWCSLLLYRQSSKGSRREVLTSFFQLNNRESYNMARAIIQTSQTSLEPSIQPVSYFFMRNVRSSLLKPWWLAAFLIANWLAGRSCMRSFLSCTTSRTNSSIPTFLRSLKEWASVKLFFFYIFVKSTKEEERSKSTQLIGHLICADRSTLVDDMNDVWSTYLTRFPARWEIS